MDGRRPLGLLHAFVLVLLHFMIPAIGFDSWVGDAKAIGCIEREREALLEFKQGLVDDYGRLSTWGIEDHKKNCCEWRGVRCSYTTGHVVELDLGGYMANQPLRGKVSPSLIELQHLDRLDFSNNIFNYTQIPEFIGSLSNLKYLNLSNASFNGHIPSQLGNFSRLLSLDLSMNDLIESENLEWLSHLSSLEDLELSEVDLTQAHDWLDVVSHLSKLSNLNLVSCGLPPITLSSLSHINSSKFLTTINLQQNSLTSSIFQWLFNYTRTSLVHLYLSSNELQGSIPDAIGNMNSLETLSLSHNHLEGGIPKSLLNICTLRRLDLSNNSLSGQLVELTHNFSGCKKYSLEILHLYENHITGSLPSFSMFPSLEEIRLGLNNLNGTITASIGNLSKLKFLGLRRNHLKGVISQSQMSNFPKLQYLLLSHNSLTLKFDFDWVPPFQLLFIDLRSCILGYDFPNWIKTQKNFEELDISNTGISDTIPMGFWDLPSELKYLNLSYNQISGSLPILSTKFVGLPVLDLSSNNFEGPLPVVSSNLTSLNLSKNKFSGLNSSLCTFAGQVLYYLDLSNNQLSGGLPNCFMHWQDLVVLNLANNNLSGEIPISMGSLIKLRRLDLSNNSFSGELPWSLQNCTILKFMNMRENKLSGEIPAWLGEKLSSLIVLSLGSNEFHGSIPLPLCQLTYIQLLDLSQNNISRTIPWCLNNLTAMAHKYSLDTNELIAESKGSMIMFDNNAFAFAVIGIIGGKYVINTAFSFTVIEIAGNYVVNTLLGWKGNVLEYGKNFRHMRSIDLSNNKLTGNIPQELFSLLELKALNLSRNMLTGIIPPKIGQLKQLESLDLSRNRLSGSIPINMANLHFLSYLDLSHNYLSGKIPTGTQLQTFSASSFTNNLALCGRPLTLECTKKDDDNGKSNEDNQEVEDEFWKWFYIGMGPGCTVGFGGVFGSLLLNHSWRRAYFLLLVNLKDWLYVTMVVHKARLQRLFHQS